MRHTIGEHTAREHSNQENQVEYITPPNLLKFKVSGGGPLDLATLAKADAAITALGEDFPTQAKRDLARVLDSLERAKVDADGRKEHVAEIHAVVHELRGLGGTFGYILVSRIGNSLCRFVEVIDAVDDMSLTVPQAHVDALRAVITTRIKGDGGDLGREIARELDKLTQPYVSQTV